MASHLSFDRELIGEMMAGVRLHYKGMFAFGIDHTVVNVTKDHIWIREAALPETTNMPVPTMEWMHPEPIRRKIPGEMTINNPFLAGQEQSVRELEIDPALFTPKDQIRQWARLPAQTQDQPGRNCSACQPTGSPK